MKCMFFYDKRPPRTAKKCRIMWDELTKVHGHEPSQIGLYVSEGGFRDWHIRVGEKTFDFEDAIIGKPSIIDPVIAARSTAQTGGGVSHA